MKLIYALRPRRRHQPAAAIISSETVDGSGTAVRNDKASPEPLPLPGNVWPKWARHTLKSAGV